MTLVIGEVMGDVLKADVVLGMSANVSSELGLVTMTDNHGNATRGHTLTCSGSGPRQMTDVEWADMHAAIVPSSAVAINATGEIPMLGGLESPLQTLCRKLEAHSKPSKH